MGGTSKRPEKYLGADYAGRRGSTQLPTIAYAAPTKLRLGLFCLGIAAFFGLLSYLSVISLSGRYLDRPLWEIRLGLAIFVWGTAICLAAAINHFWDALQREQLVVLEIGGIRDLRWSPELIPWKDVAFYRIENLPRAWKSIGITLFLRRRGPKARSLLRAFLIKFPRFLSPKADRIYVSFSGLTISREALAREAEARIKHYGGELLPLYGPRSKKTKNAQ